MTIAADPSLRRAWPAEGAAGTVLVVHGLGEHAGRYDAFARDLNAAGWSVVAYDLPGHGRSAGPRGRIPGDDAMAEAVCAAIDAERAAGAAPLVLLGHSMGGAIAADVAIRALRPIDGLVLSSPALAIGLTASQRVQLVIGAKLLPDAGRSNGLTVEKISHDPDVVAAYRADPLVHGTVTPRLIRAIDAMGTRALERAATLAVPALLLWAGDDALVDVTGSERFARDAPSARLTAIRLDGMYHEIFNEVDRERALLPLREWLRATFGQRATPA